MYSKKEYCVYCDQCLTSRISKHYLNMHSDEEDIKAALLADKEGKKNLLYKAQSLGNFKHNTKVHDSQS